MESFAVNQNLRLRSTIRHPDTNALESPPALDIIVTEPDGTVTVYPAAAESLGIWSAVIFVDQLGVHHWRSEDPAGPAADPASAESSYFLVRL